MSSIKRQGDLHEAAAVQTIGNGAVNLNGAAARGQIGGNFPTYDVSSFTEIASVKSHMSAGTQLTQQDTNAYIQDFYHQLGYGRAYQDGLSPIEQDAQNMIALRDSGYPVPTELVGANSQQIGDYLQTKSTLRIPDDHVQAVREKLAEECRHLPENFGLSGQHTDAEIQPVIERVRGSGLTTQQTIEQLAQEDQSEQVQAQLGQAEQQPGQSQTIEGQGEDEDYQYGYGY